MKKYLIVVVAVLCLGLCSCVVNVRNDPEPSMGKVKVIFDLARYYDSGWITIREIRVVNVDSGLKYTFDEKLYEGEGYSFKVKPGYYYVEVDARSRYSGEWYTRSTRSIYVGGGYTVEAIFDGDRVYFY